MRSVATLGVGVLAVVCCAGAPLVVGLVGGTSLAALLGAGVGGLVAASLVAGAVVAVRARRRRACAARPAQPRSFTGADA